MVTARNSVEVWESRKRNETLWSLGPIRALTCSFWLCYAKLWVGKQKSKISGSWCRQMLTLREEQLGNVGKKKDEEKELDTKWRRK